MRKTTRSILAAMTAAASCRRQHEHGICFRSREHLGKERVYR